MLFNSLHFLIFFPLVLVLFFAVQPRRRLPLLFAASCYFYMAFIPAYILILFLLIAIDYTAGILIERSQGPGRKRLLILSLAANIGLLGIFKYFNFFSANIAAIGNWLGVPADPLLLSWALPIGLSFHTFQSMSYTIEVYRGRVPAERNLLVYSVYVLFFPQMVAGPIERPYNLLPQLHRTTHFDRSRLLDGVRLMTWGFFQKVVVADRLAIYANQVFQDPAGHAGATVALGIYFFSFQIYCDFCGYSNIAIGAARIMGYDLMTNFNRPYSASSIADFWKRWHISLSSWFRDYVYIPLGGNRVGRARWYANLMIVFLVSGFWHGANWTFLIWGGLHGAYLIAEIVLLPLGQRLMGILRTGGWALHTLRVVVTFHLVSFAWIFFRARDLSEAGLIIRNLFRHDPRGLSFELPYGGVDLAIAILGIGVLMVAESLRGRVRISERLAIGPRWVRWSVYYATVLGILFFGVLTQNEFIYFQF